MPAFLFALLLFLTPSFANNVSSGISVEIRKIKFSPKNNLEYREFDLTTFGFPVFLKPDENGIVNEFGLTYGHVFKKESQDLNVLFLRSYRNLTFYHTMLLKPEGEFFGIGFGYGLEYQRAKFYTNYQNRYTTSSCSIPFISSCPSYAVKPITTVESYRKSRISEYLNPFVNFRIEIGREFALFTDFQYFLSPKGNKKKFKHWL